MKYKFLPLFFFFLLLVEGIVVAMLPGFLTRTGNIFVPHFTLLALLFMAVYYEPKTALLFAGIFGFLYDVIYVEIIGVYLLGFILIIYLFSYLMKVLYDYLFVVIFLSIWAIGFMEYFSYGFMLLTDRTLISHHQFLYHRLIPTALFNIVFLVVFGYFLKMFFVKLKTEKEKR